MNKVSQVKASVVRKVTFLKKNQRVGSEEKKNQTENTMESTTTNSKILRHQEMKIQLLWASLVPGRMAIQTNEAKAGQDAGNDGPYPKLVGK